MKHEEQYEIPLSPLERLAQTVARGDFYEKQGAEWKKEFGHLLEDLPPKFRTRNGLTLHVALLAKSSDTVLEYHELPAELEVVGYVIHPANWDKTTDITCECGKTHIAHEVIVCNTNNGLRTRLGTSCAKKLGLHIPKQMKAEAEAEIKGAEE